MRCGEYLTLVCGRQVRTFRRGGAVKLLTVLSKRSVPLKGMEGGNRDAPEDSSSGEATDCLPSQRRENLARPGSRRGERKRTQLVIVHSGPRACRA